MVSAHQLKDAEALAEALSGVRAGDFDEGERALLEALRGAIDAVLEHAAAGQAGLTPRETEVLDRVAAGDTNVLIARHLGVRPRTVDKHLEHVYAKLGVCSRTAAVARIREIAH